MREASRKSLMATSEPSVRSMREAVNALKKGGVVAYPTDTLYGLGADPLCIPAVDRVFEIKGRPVDMALPLLLRSVDDLALVAAEVPDLAWTLAERFWPGPLTMVLRKSPWVPRKVSGGRGSIAVRMPDHSVPLALAGQLGRPITGTSANPSGGPDPVTARDVETLLGDRVDYILDGGPAPLGRPSTIVDLTGSRPSLVRAGAIPFSSIEAVFSTPAGASRREGVGSG